jgi:hypothetical protein
MKKTILIMILLVTIHKVCFPQTGGVMHSKIVSLSLKDTILPKNLLLFHELFTIRITDIDSTYDSLQLILYSIDRKKYKRYVLQKPTTYEQFIKDNATYNYSSNWKTRNIDFSGTVCDIPIYQLLNASEDYVIELKGRKKSKPTKSKVASAIAKMQSSTSFKNDITKAIINLSLENKFSDNPTIAPLQETSTSIEYVANEFLHIHYNDLEYKMDSPTLQSLYSIVGKLNNYVNIFTNSINFNKTYDRSSNQYDDAISELKDALINDITYDSIKYDNLLKKLIDPIKDTSDPLFKDTSSLFQSIDSFINQKITLIDPDQIIKNFEEGIFSLIAINTTYPPNFLEHSRLYVTLDAGVAYNFKMDRWPTYVGVNIYFSALKKSIPLKQYIGLHNILASRTSMLVGITTGSIEEPGIRKGIIGNKALILGLGFRVTTFMKVNTGMFFYYLYDKNPTVSNDLYRTTASPFVSLSLDLDAKSLFGGLWTSIFPNN